MHPNGCNQVDILFLDGSAGVDYLIEHMIINVV